MFWEMLPTILSLASSNKDGGAKAQDIGSLIRMGMSSAKTAKMAKKDFTAE